MRGREKESNSDPLLFVGCDDSKVRVYNADFSLESILEEPNAPVTLMESVFWDGAHMVAVGTENGELFLYDHLGEPVQIHDFRPTHTGKGHNLSQVLLDERIDPRLIAGNGQTSKIFGPGLKYVSCFIDEGAARGKIELVEFAGKPHFFSHGREGNHALFNSNYQLIGRWLDTYGSPVILKSFADEQDRLLVRMAVDGVIVYDEGMNIIKHIKTSRYTRIQQVTYKGEPAFVLLSRSGLRASISATVYDSNFSEMDQIRISEYAGTPNFKDIFVEQGYTFITSEYNGVLIFDDTFTHKGTLTGIADYYCNEMGDEDDRQSVDSIHHFEFAGELYYFVGTCAGELYTFDSDNKLADFSIYSEGDVSRVHMKLQPRAITLDGVPLLKVLGKWEELEFYNRDFHKIGKIDDAATHLTLSGFDGHDFLATASYGKVVILDKEVNIRETLEMKTLPTHLLQHTF